MGAVLNRPEQIDPGGVRKLLRLVDSLRATPAGSMIYRQLEDMLDDIASSHLRAEIAYSGFVNVLLDAFTAHLTPGSSAYVQIKLLQARLEPPLTPTELDTLSEFIGQCDDQIRNAHNLDSSVMRQAVSPLLEAFGIEAVTAAAPSPAQPEPPEATPDSMAPAVAGEAEAEPRVEPEDDEDDDDGISAVKLLAESLEDEDVFDDQELYEDEISAEIPAGQDLNDLHRSQLEARREDIQKLQETLGQQVQETITQNEEFGVILEVALAELRETGDITEIENMRWTLIREVEKLMKGHNELADKLDNTYHYLQLFESDSRELSDELTRVRLLSLTDELTGLPNRRAFMRRLEDEVARVQRYGFPLSFVLIDLDHFKTVNDDYGHAAGDEVLRVYSKNILSIFRHHDMVARYGGEEFAVLLPNTDSDGTVRALNKVRRRANETRWQTNGKMADVPTFSAGVSLYKPGESASAFIERADKALYRAKRLGRNRIELDMTYQTESSEGAPRRRSTDS
jgi:diguanylate cyclase (GGDEF)-like protein